MRQAAFGVFVLTALAASIMVGRAQDYRRPTALPLQDVSGTWVLDDPKGSGELVLPDQRNLTITQTANLVTIQTPATSASYRTDGTETMADAPGRPRTATARWVGNILMVTTKGEATTPNDGESIALYALNVGDKLEVISQFNLTDGAAKGISFIKHQYKRQ